MAPDRAGPQGPWKPPWKPKAPGRVAQAFVLPRGEEFTSKGPAGRAISATHPDPRGPTPDRIRAQVLGPFGKPLLTMTSDGLRLTVLDYRGNRAFHRPGLAG